MKPRQIIENASNRMAVIDLESKLLQSNIIFITGEIYDETIATYQAELFYLTSKLTAKDTEKTPIKIYINSPGGEVYSLLGFYDVMQHFINKGYIIQTICVGLAASAASIILMAGSKGQRLCMPNTTVMVHQPSFGSYGTVTDVSIDLKESERLKTKLNEIVKKHASEDLIQFMERDKWLSAEEALKYNIVDKIA